MSDDELVKRATDYLSEAFVIKITESAMHPRLRAVIAEVAVEELFNFFQDEGLHIVAEWEAHDIQCEVCGTFGMFMRVPK